MARKNALLDVLGDAYVRGMARNVNALAEIAGKPFPDPRVYARGAEFVPGVGDAVGLGQDVRGYAEDPKSLTPWAALGSLAALAPVVPRANKIAPKITDELTDYYSGQKNMLSRATVDGKPVGFVKWSIYAGEPQISMIEVSPEMRRKGVATALIENIRRQFPDTPIDPGGYATEDGQAFMKAIGLLDQ